MKFAILSLAATAGLALSAGDASAQWGHGGHNHGHNQFHGFGGHLDSHNGHLHYHNGFQRSGPLYPAYPSYNYGYSTPYSSGYGPNYGSSYYSPLNSGYGSYYTPRSSYGYGLRW